MTPRTRRAGALIASGARVSVELGVLVGVLLYVRSSGKAEERTAGDIRALTKAVGTLEAVVAPLTPAVARLETAGAAMAADVGALERRSECTCRQAWQVQPGNPPR